MKRRIIDMLSVPNERKPVDKVWEVFSHYLITSFGDTLIQNGIDPNHLDEIYCAQRVRDLDEKTLDSIVYTVPPAFINSNDEQAENVNHPDIHWGASPKTPFLLLGHVGTGKTTFLDYTFLHRLPKNDIHLKAIIVDFMKSEDKKTSFTHFMLTKINDYLPNLCSELKSINHEMLSILFKVEVENIVNTIKNIDEQNNQIDKLFTLYVNCHLPGSEDHFKELVRRKIEFAKSKNHKIWLIIDNIDQHHNCLHNDTFVSTVSIANSFNIPLIITMRYITLATPDARSAYNSYRPRKLKLSSPDVTVLISKRLSYFKFKASHIMEAELSWTANMLTVNDLVTNIEQTTNLLAESGFVKRYLLPISNYNLRRLLEIVLSVYQSYFFFYDRFNNTRYIPNKSTLLKRFIYAHLLKNEDYYSAYDKDEKECFIINLFENENKTSEYNQTIRIRLLQAMMNIGKRTTLNNLTTLILNTFKYDEDDLLQAYRAFFKTELFTIKGGLNSEFDTAIIHDVIMPEHIYSSKIEIALTYSGNLHYDMLTVLEYVEIMKFSTYVPDALYNSIQSEEKQKNFASRAKSTKNFLSYIDEAENEEMKSGVKNIDLFKRFFGRTMPTIARSLEDQLKHIETKYTWR